MTSYKYDKINYEIGDLVYLRFLNWKDADFDRLYKYQAPYNDYPLTWKGLVVNIDLSDDDILIVDVLIDDKLFKGLKASNWYKVPDENYEFKA